MDEYLELIRMALSVRLRALTGIVWEVVCKRDNLDVQFRYRCGKFRVMGEPTDMFRINLLENLPHFVEHETYSVRYAWFHGLSLLKY